MLVVIRGAGDIASGIALRLYRAGIRLVLTDLPNPTAVRRTVCFSEAIRLGEVQVEDVAGRLAHNSQEALELTKQGIVPVLADPRSSPWGRALRREWTATQRWRPCGATPWAGCSIPALPSPTPVCRGTSEATPWSACSALLPAACSSPAWRSELW